MAILRTTAAVAILGALAGCELQREPTSLEFSEEQVAVHSVLVAGTDTATVLLTRVRPGTDDTLEDPLIAPLTGATVRISAGGDTLDLVPGSGEGNACIASRRTGFQYDDQLRSGCYAAAVPGGVRSGRSYALIVHLPGGALVRGSARVPEPPVLLSPEAGTEIALDPDSGLANPPAAMPVTWESYDPDRRLELRLDMARQDCAAVLRDGAAGYPFAWREVSGADSVSLWVANIECREPDPGAPDGDRRFDARVMLTAFDSAYTRYARDNLGNSVHRVDAAVGVTGAIGVFAGAASATVPVVVVRP